MESRMERFKIRTYMLPPRLRQLVMDTAINRGIVHDPYCLALLISILNDTKSISIQIDSSYTTEFFQRLRESMRAMLLNGERVDADITKLHFRYFRIDTEFRYAYRGRWNRVLENWAENCIELSISNAWRDLNRPIININQLTTLKLDNCDDININEWQEFLRHFPTLEHLQMIDVTFRNSSGLDDLDKFLPFSMSRLKSLEIIGKYPSHRFICNKAFVDNLIGCPELLRVRLILDESSDEASLTRLTNMNITMEIEARFIVTSYDDSVTSESKLVRIFRDKVDSMKLLVFVGGEWKPHFSAALEDIVSNCLNLTSFHISINEAVAISEEDMERINAALVRFFANSDRALKLKDLNMRGNFNEAVVSAVIENCLNLVQLIISYCPALQDQHLIDWANRGGGKLSKFTLYQCENVTSEGVIPILVKSAEDLLRYRIIVHGQNLNEVLKNHCPNAQLGNFEY